MNFMAKKKANSSDELVQRKSHAYPARLLRLHPVMWDQLDSLVELNKSNATEEIRRAIREYLERNNLWPPSTR